MLKRGGRWEEAPSQQIPDGLLDTCGGRMRVEWVRLCPLRFTSKNAPSKEKILGTILLSILAGHKRSAQMTSVRADKVLPELLGMVGIASEDSVRRAFPKGEEADSTLWMDESMNKTFEPLLFGEWVLNRGGHSMASRKRPRSAAVRRNRGGLRLSITPASLPSCAWC